MPKEEQTNTNKAAAKTEDVKDADKKKDVPKDDKGQPLSE
jgi:26S proteasome regulatory subunit T1